MHNKEKYMNRSDSLYSIIAYEAAVGMHNFPL